MVNKKEVRKARKDAGFTTVELAKIIGGSTRTISEIETGKRQPSIATLEKIAQATRREMSEFFNTEEKVA